MEKMEDGNRAKRWWLLVVKIQLDGLSSLVIYVATAVDNQPGLRNEETPHWELSQYLPMNPANRFKLSHDHVDIQ